MKRNNRHNSRGAAFLLAVYFSALILLLLGGVSLQRTNTEVRASQLSRDMQQAFWYSEAAIDNYLTRKDTETFASGDAYPTSSLGSSATFNATPTAGEIRVSTTPSIATAGKNVVHLSQQVTRKVTGTGASGGTAKAYSSAYVQESGPLRGLWANKTIAVGGGRNLSPDDKILYGDLHSGLGSVVSTIKEAGALDKLEFDGLIKVTEEVQSDWNATLDYWASQASEELISIKNGYGMVQGAAENLSQVEGSYSAVDFVSGSAASSAAHVSGSLSVGSDSAIGSTVVDPGSVCGGTIHLNSAKVQVNDAMYCMFPGKYDTGMTCDGGPVGDMDLDPDHISLCVNAIVPGSDQLWLDTLMDKPPILTFNKPTTIVVTGSAPLSTAGMSVYAPLFNTMVSTDTFANPALKGTSFYVQNQWNVAVGAQLQAYDGTEAAPVQILQQRIDSAKLVKFGKTPKPPGMMFIKPGNDFKGAIYSPLSLVVVRARDCSVTNSCEGPMTLQYVVGNEVVIELEGEKMEIGETAIDEDKDKPTLVDFKAWSAR